MRRCLIIIALLFGLVVLAQTPNHNAVLITGDTPEGVAEKIQNALESGDSLYDSLGLWGFQEAKEESVRYEYNEFWNDTYLMWELLWKRDWPNDNIHVLYGDGEDYDQLNPRYQAPWPLPQITDRPAYFTDVKDVLEDLAYGDDSAGIVPMDSDDNLFCWTFDHGAGTTTRELILDKDFNVISETYYPGYGFEHSLKDSLLYICLNDPATDNGWLSILNIGEPSNPEKFVGCFETPYMIRDIIVDGNYAYITNKIEGVKILDISNPSSIKETDRYDPDVFTAMALDDVYYDTLHLLAVVNLINGVHWLNITQPDTFKYYSKADFLVGSGVGDLEVKDSIAFCCFGSRGIAVADFKNLITFYQWDNCDARDIVINDTLAYIADGENDFTILNIKEPDKIEFISNLNVPGTGNGLFYQSDTVYLAAGSAGIMTIDVSDPYSPSVINSYWPHNRRAYDIVKSGSLLYTLFSGEHYPDVSLCLMGRSIMDREFASLINSITTNKGIFWMQQCLSGGFIDNLKGPNNIISTSCSIFESAYPADDKDIEGNFAIENEVLLKKNTYFHGEYDFHIMNAVRQKKIWPYFDPPPYEPIDSSAYIWNRGTSMFECKTYVSHHDSRFILEGSEHPQFSDSGGIASSSYLEWDDLLPPAIPEGFLYRYKRETDYNWGIKLQWEDNDEVDMSGFYLYKNNILFDSTYKDTQYIDYDIDNYKGDTVQYSLTAFDLRDRESPQTNLSFTIPITISNTSSSTGYNNARRLLSYHMSIYLLYLSNNRVYCIISEDNGSTWESPELVSDSSYAVKAPAGGVTEDGKIIAVWVRENDKLMFSVRDNGVWSNPALIEYPDFNIHSLGNPAVVVTDDTCRIFIDGIWRDIVEGARYCTKWLYGKFAINNPEPEWLLIDTKDGIENTSSTITCTDNIPFLSYYKEYEIIYTQPVNGVWYKWNISNSPDRFSKKPNIDYGGEYINLVWIEENAPSSGIPVIECVSIVPASDSNLNYQPIPFKDRPFFAEEPFVISKQWLYWEENSFGKCKIKRLSYDETTFSWDYPEYVSDISWADARYPQAVYYRPRTDSIVAGEMVIASGWSEGEEQDIGIQERDEQIGDFRFASSNLGQSFSSPYQIQRAGYINYSNGSKPYEMVDYHPQELIYKIEGLDTDLRYRLKLGLFQRSDAKWKERIEVDGASIGELWLNSGGVVWFESEIPAVHTQDGEITVKVIKVTGNYAVCGALYLYEYSNNKGAKSVDSPEISAKPTQYEFYIKPISYGKMELEFGLPEECKVELKIYDATGRCVRTVVDRLIEAGIHKVNIEGLSAGVYFYNFRAGGKAYNGKILNIR